MYRYMLLFVLKNISLGFYTAGGTIYIPSSSGVCFNLARLGNRDKDGCTNQNFSAGQLREALGNTSGQKCQFSSTEKPPAKGAERGNSHGARGNARQGQGQTTGKTDAAPSKEDDGKIDMNALQTAVRRRLSRPMWCTIFETPHHSATVVAEIREREAAVTLRSDRKSKQMKSQLTRFWKAASWLEYG